MSDMDIQQNSMITTARWLGYTGAIPFLGLAILSVWPFISMPVQASFALQAYGAVILSFLGGLHWGRAASLPSGPPIFSAQMALLWSVSLSLGGWAGVLFPFHIGVFLLGAGFIAALLADLWLLARGYWPELMRALRLHLSLIALASLLFAALFGKF